MSNETEPLGVFNPMEINTSPVNSPGEAIKRAQDFVSSALKTSVESAGVPSIIDPPVEWKVPLIVEDEYGQKHDGVVTILQNGEIVQNTDYLLEVTFGLDR